MPATVPETDASTVIPSPADRPAAEPTAQDAPEETAAEATTPDPAPAEEATAVQDENAAPQRTYTRPVRIWIPKLNVNARVIPVGEDPDGSMSSPGSPFDVGWWDRGVLPGKYGSVVLGGHVDWAGYGPAVFWNLKSLAPGDRIDVVGADNSLLTYQVTELDTYRFNDKSVLPRIFTQTEYQGLNLITCTGIFDPRSRNYDRRIVVYASLVAE